MWTERQIGRFLFGIVQVLGYAFLAVLGLSVAAGWIGLIAYLL